MRRLVLFLFLLQAAHAADWPQFNGPAANCTSPETGINKEWRKSLPKDLWRITLGDHGYGGPSVANGKLYIVDHKEGIDVLRAVDITIGKDAWTLEYPNAGPEDEYGFTRSTPLYSDGKIYVLSRHGLLLCADDKGQKLWTRDLVADFQGKRPNFYYSHSPAVDGNHLIVCPGGPNTAMVCLDKSNGKEIWRGGGSEEGGYCTPVVGTINGKKQYVVFTGLNAIGVDAETGKLIWSQPWRTQFDLNIASPVVSGDTVFISSDYNKGCALLSIAGDKVNVLWENKLMATHFNSPVLLDGCYYGNSGNATKPGEMVCLDAKTGNACWSQPGYEAGGIISVDGVNFALNGRTGELVMFKIDRQAYHETGHLRGLGGQSWTAPIFADGKLFIRNRDALLCINMK
jgi:outer membrane protein assembly factor BamB